MPSGSVAVRPCTADGGPHPDLHANISGGDRAPSGGWYATK